MERENIRRIKWVMAVAFILLSVLTARTGHIQIAKGEELSRLCLEQQLIPVQGISLRGQIYDRNMEKLTYSEMSYYCFVPAESVEGNSDFDRIIRDGQWKSVTKKSQDYAVFKTSKYDECAFGELVECFEAYILTLPERCDEKSSTACLIGMPDESGAAGAYGLEREFDKYLREGAQPEKQIFLYADVNGKILRGKAPVIGERTGSGWSYAFCRGGENTGDGKSDFFADIEFKASGEQGEQGGGIVLSIDKELQSECFEALKNVCANADEEDVRGGSCIVNDAYTGEILAMVSFDAGRGDADAGFGEDGADEDLATKNCCKAISAVYSPGKLFEIIATACRFEDENHSLREDEDNSGSEGNGEVEGNGEGEEEGERYFFVYGDDSDEGRFTYEKVLHMALKSGLGERVLGSFEEERTGHLPYSDEVSEAGFKSVIKGGGGVLITPIQAAQLVSVLANHGEKANLSVILGFDSQSDKFDGDTGQSYAFSRTRDYTGNLVDSSKVWSEATSKEAEAVLSDGLVGSDTTAKQSYGAFFTCESNGEWDGEELCFTQPAGWTAGYFDGTDDAGGERRYVVTIALEGEQGEGKIGTLCEKSKDLFRTVYGFICR